MGYGKYPTKDLKLYIEEDFDNEKNIRLYHKTKDIELRNKIVINNLRLVINIANEYRYPANIPLGDLIGVGTITLINAIEKYDPTKKIKFSTYVTNSIINEISGSVNEWYGEGKKYYGDIIKKYRSIAISIFDEEMIFNEDVIDYVLDIMLEQKLIRKGTISEIKSRLLSIGLYKVNEMDKQIDFETNEEALSIPYNDNTEFDRISFIKEHKEELYEVLSDYEKELMEYRCGYIDGHPYTVIELSKIYGISHQAIQQQCKKATVKMKKVANKFLRKEVN